MCGKQLTQSTCVLLEQLTTIGGLTLTWRLFRQTASGRIQIRGEKIRQFLLNASKICPPLCWLGSRSWLNYMYLTFAYQVVHFCWQSLKHLPSRFKNKRSDNTDDLAGATLKGTLTIPSGPLRVSDLSVKAHSRVCLSYSGLLTQAFIISSSF